MHGCWGEASKSLTIHGLLDGNAATAFGVKLRERMTRSKRKARHWGKKIEGHTLELERKRINFMNNTVTRSKLRTIKPATAKMGGTSSSQGQAAEIAKQKHCSWTLSRAHPSHSHDGPQQQQGRHPAPALQQRAQFKQQHLVMDAGKSKRR